MYCGDWLERDSSNENRNFVGLVFWKSSIQMERLQRLLETNNQVSALAGLADTVISFTTKPLHHESSDTLKPQELVSPPTSIQTKYNPILNLPITRRYNIATSGNQVHPDPVQMKTREQAKLKQRICAGPGRFWYPMGSISQYSMPEEPALNDCQKSMIRGGFFPNANGRLPGGAIVQGASD